MIVQVANIQHLATPIRAQLARAGRASSSWPASLHPTPAVGRRAARGRGAADPARSRASTAAGTRARSAGRTTNEDGEFCVALRCALLTGPSARCTPGVGVVRDSDPAAELAETEVKLRALLPVVSG